MQVSLDLMAGRAMDDVSEGFPARLQGLLAEPEIGRWARDCGWVPGSGRCTHRGCAAACLFRPQRETELTQIRDARRRRRAAHRPFAARRAPLAAAPR